MTKRRTNVNASADSWGLPKPEWAKRRRLLYLALVFCAVWLSWVLYKGTDSVLYQNALYVLGGGAVGLIGQYVFGAAWDDAHYMQAVAQMKSGNNNSFDSNNDNSSSYSSNNQNQNNQNNGNGDGNNIPPPENTSSTDK